jgi:flagellar biosynthesis protein
MPEQNANGNSRRAVALRYRESIDSAPQVVAKGRGAVAERILELAAEADIPVSEDPSLVEVLVKLDLNAAVPPEMYVAIAEIFAWAYRQDRDYGRRKSMVQSTVHVAPPSSE